MLTPEPLWSTVLFPFLFGLYDKFVLYACVAVFMSVVLCMREKFLFCFESGVF